MVHGVLVVRRLVSAPVSLGVLAVILVLATVACATYHAEPLPAAETLQRAPAPDMQRLQVEAAQLHHPVLTPVALDLSNGLTPDEAAVLAVLANPGLKAVRDAHGEAAAQLVGAGLLPNPVFSGEVDHPHGAGSEGTVNATNLSLEMPLGELVGRSARVAAAGAQLASVDLGIAWREWQVAQAARLAAQRVGWLGERVALADAELAAETETAKTLEAAMGNGDATAQDVGVQRAAVAGLEASRGELARTETSARGELNALLGLPAEFALEVTGPGDPAARSWPALPAADELVRRALADRLDLAALRRGYDAQEEAVRAAVLAQFPSLSVGVVRQRNETALKFLGGFVTLGLPIFDRNQAAIAGERATRTRLRDEYTARIADVRAQVHTLRALDKQLGAQLSDAAAAVAHLAQAATDEQEALARGDVDRLTYQTVRSALSDARLRLGALAQARAETRVALEAEVGAPLGSKEVAQ